MFGQYVPGLPGIRSAKTARHKVIFKGGYIPDILPAGKAIDGAKSRDPSNSDNVAVLQPGLIMGKITSGGLYAPSILGVLSGAALVGATSLTVGTAVGTEIVRRFGATGTFKLVGPPTANGVTVIETITYSGVSGGTITVTAIANAFVAGSFVMPTDGSETPITFLPDGHGVPVLEYDGTAIAVVQFPELPVSGLVYSSQLVNWPTDTSLQAWLVARLNDANGGQFVFDHRYN